VCDWDDREAKELLIDALVRDARAVLGVLDGEVLAGVASDAAGLLGRVAGQDVEQGVDGVFRIVRGVARDRVISTVDPEARHGHKSRNRRFDGYKGHVSVDPDSELIDDVTVTPANSADQDAVDDLLEPCTEMISKPTIMGDSAYAGGDLRARLKLRGFTVTAKVPPASNRDGLFSKDRFTINPVTGVVICPFGYAVKATYSPDGTAIAAFGQLCGGCRLREQCTKTGAGRTISISRHEAVIQEAKTVQATEVWKQTYRSTRPIVERKIGHLTRRAWGGRKARTRGLKRVMTDFVTRAAAINLARLDTLNVTHNGTKWATA
jgi:Transposase DDE domain